MNRCGVAVLAGAAVWALGWVSVSADAQTHAQLDALDEALDLAGLTRADLGWEARGWWQRYPQDIPYKLRHFDDLCAEPLAVVPFVRTMGHTVEQTLAPEKVAGERNGTGGGALFQAVHDLGPNKKYGATRAYTANLSAPPTPLHVALLEAWRAGGRQTRHMTFGQAPPYPVLAERLELECAAIPAEYGEVLGKLVLDLIDAHGWAERAFRRVPRETLERVAVRLDLGEEETDALEYEPAMDDMAREWDEASLWYAGLKTVEALDTARLAFSALMAGETAGAGIPPDLHLDWMTPLGRVLLTGADAQRVDVGEGAFLVVDLGGDDTYTGSLAASRPGLPIAGALDLGGNDTYEGGDGALGAGVTGIGVLLDAAGTDRYRAGTLGEGAGHFGLGVLLDLRGDDEYLVRYSGQGAGFFGVGLLIDLEGADRYTLWSDGQGFGGVAGVGVLADRAGNDTYLAVVDPGVTGRPSYHSDAKIAVSNAQGCSMGRRGDGSDGHSWAGGLGALLDASGNDTYTAGNWAQGCGYWFGTGVVWDGAGDDAFVANGWASASGAHFCIGAVIDESGNDLHSVAQNWGPAFGHDFTVSLLFDGSGNDRYVAGADGVGHSINRSVALCLEGGGDDTYTFATATNRPGLARFDPRFADRDATSIYWTESTSLGLFLDVGGTDRYVSSAAATPGAAAPAATPAPEPESPAVGDVGDGVVLTDDPGSDNARVWNRGVFVDRETGRIDLDRRHGSKRREGPRE